MSLRKTKIVATLGPSTNSHEMLEKLIAAGVNVVRLNFSHGTAQDHIDRAAAIRTISHANNLSVGILCDLQGPKIRIGKFADTKIFWRPAINLSWMRPAHPATRNASGWITRPCRRKWKPARYCCWMTVAS